MFSKFGVVSRWIILTIDISLSVFAFLVAIILQANFQIAQIDFLNFYKAVILIIAVNILVFYSVKSFTGIVRYTSAQDSFKILFSVILSSLVLFFAHALLIVIVGKAVISTVALIVYTLCNSVFLITYRILVKYFFIYIKNAQLDTIRVIIYGAGEAGVATKRTLDHDARVNKAIIAFVDDDLRKVGKTIDGIRILDAKQLESLIIEHEVDEVIFASYSIPSERKNEVVDICLEHKTNVLSVPSHEVLTGGKFKVTQMQSPNIEDLLNRKSIDIDIEGIGDQLRLKRILITGAAGSIGSEIVRQLTQFNVGLIILCDQNETALHDICLELDGLRLDKNFHAFMGDVRDEGRMEHLFKTFRPHYVYHAAAYKHVPLMEDSPSEAIKVNVRGTKIVADLAVKYGVQKFVMISTDKAVNPTNVMGASKRIAEIYVQSLNNSLHSPNYLFSNGLSYINDLEIKPITKFITTRFGNVLGSNGSVIPRFKFQIERGGPVTVTHPDITRYFMTIPEACRLVLEAGCMGEGGEIYIFDMGKSVRIVDLAKKMIRLAGLIPNEDIKIEYSGLRPGEKLYEELLNDNENTMPTHHEKIMIGKVREYVFTEIESQIYDLVKHAQNNSDRQVVMAMKALVREYKSNNSVFEELDQKLK